MRFSDDGFPQWPHGQLTIALAPRDRWNWAGPPVTSPKGVTVHSLEGTTSGGYWAFNDDDRFPTAWHWTVARTGHLYAHMPWSARGVHSNQGNVYGPAVEAEGFAPEPLTPEQVTTLRRLFTDFGDTVGFEVSRRAGTVREHREWTTTACPGDRYQPLYEQENQPTVMTAEECHRLIVAELDARGLEPNLSGYLSLRLRLASLALDPEVTDKALRAAIAAAQGQP